MFVEDKRANVALFVGGIFIDAFLELSVFLKAVFLGHRLLLFFRLQRVSFFAELAKLSLKQLVFAELTFQRPIENRNLDAGAQSDLVEALLAIAKHPRLIALKFMLQFLADHLVRCQQVGC